MNGKGRILGLGIAGLLVVVLAVLAGQFVLPEGGESTPQPPVSAPAGATVELFAQPDAGAEIVIQALDAAEESIRLKVYLLLDEGVLAALKRAVARGVEARVLIEPEPFGGGEGNRLAADELQAVGVQVKNRPAVFRYSHEKSLVVDGRRAFIMTFNLTHSSFTSNREYGVIVDDPTLVEEVSAVFDADWQGLEPALDAARLVWSPVNSRQRLQALIEGAEASLDLEQTSVLDDQVVDWLVAAVGRGVQVRLITPTVLDPEEWEYEPLSRLHAGGVAIRFLDEPYVHAKTMLADGKLAFVGSQNITATSLDSNRELGIIFDDAAALNRLASYFLQDWNAAQPWAGPQPTATLPASGIVPWQDALDYVGQTITVEGDIIDTHDAGSVTFLNFDEERTFTLVIFADAYNRFPEPPEDLYWRKRVRVTGQVKLYKGRAEIVVERPDQVEILADLLSMAGASAAPTLPANGVIGWQEAGQYLGQRLTVEGDVVRTYNSGKVVFLNFAEDYQDTLSLVIFAADFDKWPEPPEQVYLGKRVRAHGKIKEYQGAPEIVIEEPDQIEIVGEAQATLPATPTPPPVVDWREAAAHEGQEITVQGAIVDSYKSDKVIFLNFSDNRDEFKAVIFQRNWDKWPQSPDELYLGRTIRVSGEVQLYEGAPEIIVDTPTQVEIVE